jgi:Ca2+-binding EF-hand superfamily protein
MQTLLLLTLLSPAAAPPAPADDSHDLVLLTEKRPFRIRFHLRIAGRPYQSDWNRQMGQLLRFLDADGDGRLSPAEARRAPSREQWRQLSGAAETLDPDAAPDFRELARGNSHATLQDLQSYYANSTGGPLQTSWSWAVMQVDQLSDALWRRLDTDKDGKLSKAELLAARRVLAPLDGNEDEMVSMAELMGRPYGERPFLVTPGPAHGPARGGLPFFSLRPGERTDELDKALLRLYGRRFDPAPDLELLLPLDGGDHPVRVLKGPSPGLRFATTRQGEAILAGDWFVELVRPRPLPPPARRKRASSLAAFCAMDADGNGYLESEEIYRPPFALVSWLRLADRDGDGKLSREEYLAFTDLKESVQGVITSLRAEELGRSLFRFIDEDGDGRLGQRELKQAWERLAPWVAGRGAIERGQLPRHFRLTFTYGVNPGPPRQSPPSEASSRLPVVERGPLWFRKMDRNRDGDVSRKEWLGTEEQFRQIDTDGDGLISLEEAERYDRLKRGRQQPK